MGAFERLAAHGAVERGVAEGEEPTVSGHLPVPRADSGTDAATDTNAATGTNAATYAAGSAAGHAPRLGTAGEAIRREGHPVLAVGGKVSRGLPFPPPPYCSLYGKA